MFINFMIPISILKVILIVTAVMNTIMNSMNPELL